LVRILGTATPKILTNNPPDPEPASGKINFKLSGL
jgi:hypothetical protein